MEADTTDIFLWANNTDNIKQEFDVELFLFSKNYTPYSVRRAAELGRVVQQGFLYDLINTVNTGAATGLTVRDITNHDEGEHILHRANLEEVGRAETLLYLIEKERADIVEFSESEHELKRMKGVVARFSHRTNKANVFYVVKQIQQTSVVSGVAAWAIHEGQIEQLRQDAAFRLPLDNQVLIVNGDIFVFSVTKFESLFNHDARKLAVADKKCNEISQQYRLSFPDGLDLSYLLRESKALVNKVQSLDVGQFDHDHVIELIDELAVELMTDDNGAIIIMDSKDLALFLSIVNDDFVRGVGSNAQYLAKSKKLIEPEE